MIRNTAFEFLRQFKQVEPETETLVMKKVQYKVSNTELLNIFEDGISGKFGKVYSCDPQTLIGWVDEYCKGKNSNINYLSQGLASVSMSGSLIWDWEKEANKCYTAFMKGTPETDFHPCVYDELVLSGKIGLNAYEKYYKMPKETQFEGPTWQTVVKNVEVAKQKVLRDVFMSYKRNGFEYVFFIS